MKKVIKVAKYTVLTDIFNFKSSLFLTDVPYVTGGASSLIFNLNNNFILKNND